MNFWFRLALALHRPVGMLRREMDALELEMWKAFDRHHPITDARFDYHFKALRRDLLIANRVQFEEEHLDSPWDIKRHVIATYNDVKSRLTMWAQAMNQKKIEKQPLKPGKKR